METSSRPSSSAPVWQVLLFVLAAGATFLMWAGGFDWVARALRGGSVEAVINWVSNAWVWGVAGGVLIVSIICICSTHHAPGRPVEPRQHPLSSFDFPAEFVARRHCVHDRGTRYAAMPLAEVTKRLNNGELSDGLMLQIADEDVWLDLPQMQIRLHHERQSARAKQKFLVTDGGEMKGSFTIAEICLGLNRGTFSGDCTVFDAGEWIQPHEIGIDYVPMPTQPAPPWAG